VDLIRELDDREHRMQKVIGPGVVTPPGSGCVGQTVRPCMYSFSIAQAAGERPGLSPGVRRADRGRRWRWVRRCVRGHVLEHVLPAQASPPGPTAKPPHACVPQAPQPPTRLGAAPRRDPDALGCGAGFPWGACKDAAELAAEIRDRSRPAAPPLACLPRALTPPPRPPRHPRRQLGPAQAEDLRPVESPTSGERHWSHWSSLSASRRDRGSAPQQSCASHVSARRVAQAVLASSLSRARPSRTAQASGSPWCTPRTTSPAQWPRAQSLPRTAARSPSGPPSGPTPAARPRAAGPRACGAARASARRL